MKAARSSLGHVGVGSASLWGTLLLAGCGAAGNNTDKPANSAGANTGGGGASTAGMSTGGSHSQSGATTGGNGTAGNAMGGTVGSGGSSSGAAGAAGTGGSTATGFTCPAGAIEAPKLTGLTPTRVAGVPPADDFNSNNTMPTNVEGPVWIGDALYVSEIASMKPNPPPARVLKITADDKVSILIPDSGSNGLAVNSAGDLLGALHKDGSISKLSLTGGAAVPLVTMFMGARFDSPNDLTVHSNGTIYFTDPSWQAANTLPQAATRVYRVPPGGQPEAIPETFSQPNGITLSKNQDFLYVGGDQLRKYPVMADGSLGAGTAFADGGGGVDGMGLDCADNVYTAKNGVTVYSPAGTQLGNIQVSGLGQVTNVAFGGADHKTLYITGQGSATTEGLFKVQMNVPGLPF